MMQITPSVNRVPRKILGSNSNRFAPNHSFTTTPSSSSGMASSSGPNNVQQTHSISDGSAVGNANMMRPPNASSASGSGGGPPPSAMFAECWQQMSFGNNGQNTAPAGNYWPPLPFPGQFTPYATTQMGPTHRMSPSAPSGTMPTSSVPLLASAPPPMSYAVHHPMSYYNNNGNFNCGYEDNSMRYPSLMATGARMMPGVGGGGPEMTNNNNHSHQPSQASSSSTTTTGLENTTVQIKIQCINHSNPVNVNSPGNLNNLVNMSSCPNHQPANHHPGHHSTGCSPTNAAKSECTTNASPGRDSADFTLYASGVNQASKIAEKQSPTNGRNPDYGDFMKMSDYEMPDVPMVTPTTLKQTQFSEITQMAMRGCELAERLAHTHRNRPCFKKIDSLCARMKQDLVRQDSVLANINSQGMAWAVKDFIFVFTRIINAWIIIKGYVYNTPEGLAKVKTSLSPDFHESFLKWQDSTMDFVDNLIKSFVNLDQMVQSQRASFQKFDMSSTAAATSASASAGSVFNKQQCGSVQSNTISNSTGNGLMSARKRDGKTDSDLPNDETMSYVMKLFSMDSVAESNQESTLSTSMNADNSPKKLSNEPVEVTYLTNVFQDSEETQRQAMEKGTYFKTGLYNPLKKDLIPSVSGSNMNNAPQPEPKSIFTHGSAANFGQTRTLLSGGDHSMSPFGDRANSDASNKEHVLANINENYNARNNNNSSSVDQQFLQQQHHQLQMQYEQLQNHLQFLLPQTQAPPMKLLRTSVPPAPADSFDGTATKESSFMSANMEYLLAKICSLNEAKYFFASHFTKNYFPDFQTVVPNFVDLRTIVLRSHIGSYTSLHEVVHDLRQIVYVCSYYLQQRPNEFLANAVQLFDKELESILLENLFVDYDFTHITGMPDDDIRAASAKADPNTQQQPARTSLPAIGSDGRPVVMQNQDQLFCKTN